VKLAAMYFQCGPFNIKVGGYDVDSDEYRRNLTVVKQKKQSTKPRCCGDAVPAGNSKHVERAAWPVRGSSRAA
jgi:hypothetical protein